MAFIVEDGTVVQGATSYIDVAYFESYWADRNVVMLESAAQKQAALIVATQYVDNNFKFVGNRAKEDQPRSWPRSYAETPYRAIDADEIPTELKDAVAEYARRQLTEPLQPDVDQTGQLTRRRQTLEGVGSIEVEYQENTGGYFGMKNLPTADRLLEPLLGLTGMSFLRR